MAEGFCTRFVTTTATYAETEKTGTTPRPAGSVTETWTYAVVSGTTPAMFADALTCVNEQFKNMRNTADGRTVTIGAQVLETATRPNAPFAPS